MLLDKLGGGRGGGHDEVLDDVGAREGVVLFLKFEERNEARERWGGVEGKKRVSEFFARSLVRLPLAALFPLPLPLKQKKTKKRVQNC